MPTTTAENTRESTRVPVRIPLTVVSLNPNITFSEACNTVSVNAQGCALYADKSIALATPVLLRLKNGKEATGQVAFCKGSPSNGKLWGIGVVLDEPGNFWGLNPCPKDWLPVEDATVNSSSAVNPQPANPLASKPESTGITSAQFETMQAEFRQQMRQEMSDMLADARKKLDEELQIQKKNTELTEELLREAANVPQSAEHSLQESLEQKLADETKNAIERIEDRLKTLMDKARSDSENLVRQNREEAEELWSQSQQKFSSALDDLQKKFSDLEEQKNKEVAEATSSIEQVSDQVYATAQKRLENDFEEHQQNIAAHKDAISAEVARSQKAIEELDARMTRLNEVAAQQQKDFADHLEMSVLEALQTAETKLQKALGDLVESQIEQAKQQMNNELAPVSLRADSLIKELADSADELTKRGDSVRQQITELQETREEAQRWLQQQTSDFEKSIEHSLAEARSQAKTIVRSALAVIEDPIEKLNREARNKIEDFTARQQAELGDGIQRLRDTLAALEHEAESSLRASVNSSFNAPSEIISDDHVAPPNQSEAETAQDTDKSAGRGHSTFAQKLSGLVRGK
ncbi:MAG: hypothetical protein JOY93_12535 [Acidobacteriales bacterium]|nr:hypothetical protein [Terriglobales bacterium]